MNPHDDEDYLVMAQLASRPARKRVFDGIAEQCNIVVGPKPMATANVMLLVL